MHTKNNNKKLEGLQIPANGLFVSGRSSPDLGADFDMDFNVELDADFGADFD